ncbi:protein snowy cotyledon 3 [Phtheirospermum japonicum]|uniref:Protein snowy cotyledon 3 n=1 Tax=Phtheirospermum japonicum TaxID=374723 RepID=A0A830BIG5_9LAMI|nr:protein snowy cotyledon 3 [Phtheirospermum japonicum]
MVTTLLSNSNQRRSQNPKRPPSLRPDSDNAPPRRPKSREVSVRHLSLPTSSNSSSSTSTTSSSVTSGSSISTRRSQNPTHSRRPGITSTPLSSVKEIAVSAERRRPTAAKTIRSLSVSFQGESFSLLSNKVKHTPERRNAGVTPVIDRAERDRENSRPNDQQHRWPGRLGDQNSNFLSRSLDCGAERGKLNGSGNELKELRICTADEDSGNKGVKLESNNFDSQPILVDHLISESVSNNTLSRKGPSKLIVAKKFQNNSPTRTKNGVGNLMDDIISCSTPSMLGFAADVRRRKLSENRIVDAHDLRILHNRNLQWRLANMRVENALLVQEQTAEELHLENWDQIDRDHCNSLSGIINALEASTIRLPVVGGARVEQTNSLVSELSNLSIRECDLLDEIKDYLSTTFIPLQLDDTCIATSSNINEENVNTLFSLLLLTKNANIL